MTTELLAIAGLKAARNGEVSRQLDLPDGLHAGVALVIQGVRRSGKSTLLRQLIDIYDLDPDRCLLMNFEDPRLSGQLTTGTLDALVAALRERHPAPAPLTFLFDEVQWILGWERWLRVQLDRADHRFVITGSNAQLLGGELGTVLTGRHLTVEVQPFSLAEARTLVPGLTLTDYLHHGGFPAPLRLVQQQMSRDADRLLQTYFGDIVVRDVRERVAARSARPVLQVAQMAYESAGSELSYRRVAAAAGLSVDTAKAYLGACEDAYLLYRCPYFAWSERKRASRNAKYYPVDIGLRRMAVIRGGADRGKALECATFLALRQQFDEVCYWRGGGPGQGEVDFVVQAGERLVPIQVSWDGLTARHERALADFFEAFPMAAEPVAVTATSFEEALAGV